MRDKGIFQSNKKEIESIVSYLEETKDLLSTVDKDEALSYSAWIKTKTNLIFHTEINEKQFIISNCLYWAEMGYNIGSEQGQFRPVLVINTNKNSPVCTVLPLTTERLYDEYEYHINLEKRNSTVLVEHIRVISKKRIVEPLRISGKIESITKNDWEKINTQLRKLYTLKPLK